MSETTTELPTHGVNLTEVAQTKVRTLLEQEGRTDLRLRIAVQPGGCSGLIYQLYFDERVLDGDAVRDFDGVEVIVDKMSAPYLDGSTIDFEDTIEKQGFSIDNPNAAGSCACGDSFHYTEGTHHTPLKRNTPKQTPVSHTAPNHADTRRGFYT